MERRLAGRIYSLLERIESAITLIQSQQDRVCSPDYFLESTDGQFTLSGMCMQLAFIGETVKVIDHHAEGYLTNYPNIPWKQIKGLRDIMSHEYHNVDNEEIYNIVFNDLPLLLQEVIQMKQDLYQDLMQQEK